MGFPAEFIVHVFVYFYQNNIDVFTHAPCGSVGQQTDFLLLLLLFPLHTSNFLFLLGTENAVGGHGSLAVYAILFVPFLI